jgi:hypothetical protein
MDSLSNNRDALDLLKFVVIEIKNAQLPGEGKTRALRSIRLPRLVQ